MSTGRDGAGLAIMGCTTHNGRVGNFMQTVHFFI
jgi:hypothetical protein